MRKALILIIVGLLIIGVFFTPVCLKVPLGEPQLRMEFYPQPPWRIQPGDSLEVSLGVAKDT